MRLLRRELLAGMAAAGLGSRMARAATPLSLATWSAGVD